jgi:hypothetical protein
LSHWHRTAHPLCYSTYRVPNGRIREVNKAQFLTCTRITNKKQEQQCWRVPYCSACLSHVRTQDGAKAECCTMGPAVVYDNWHGTVHTFRFLSRAYAAAFREANAKKVLG